LGQLDRKGGGWGAVEKDVLVQRTAERDLNMGDLLYVLKNGFVYEPPEQATQPGLWKYKIETRSPNSGNRVVRAVVISDVSKIWAKIITLMWADE
jgi:hypothetical protein